MAGELEFDAAGSNLDGTNPGTNLAILSNATYGVSEMTFPAPQPTVQWATSVDTEGSLPAAVKHENRQITISMDVMSAAGLRALEQKLGKIIREQGTLKLTLPNSEVIIFDLLSVDSYEPQFNQAYWINSGAFCSVNLVMTGKPYGRGPEVTTLSDHVETTNPWVVFTETTIKGDWYGLARLVVDNDEAGLSMRWASFGIRSRNYSSASTAAVFYQAESCALSSGTLAVGPADSSGGGSNTVFYGALDVTTTGLMYLGTSSSAQTHVGTYRVFARVYAPNTNTGTVSLNVSWTPSTQGITIDNTYVPLATTGGPLEQQWVMVDLGLVTLPRVKKGSQGWVGLIDGKSTVAGDDIYIDWVALVPADEGYGEAYALETSSSPLAISAASIEARWDGVLQQATGSTWPEPDVFEGDNLLIPPSAPESRTLQVITRFSRHIPLSASRSLTTVSADVVGDVSAKLNYTPRYLVVPEP